MWGLDWSHRVPVTCQAVNYKQMPPISISEGISSPAFALHIFRVHPLKWCLMGQGARWVASHRPGLSSEEPTAFTGRLAPPWRAWSQTRDAMCRIDEWTDRWRPWRSGGLGSRSQVS